MVARDAAENISITWSRFGVGGRKVVYRKHEPAVAHLQGRVCFSPPFYALIHIFATLTQATHSAKMASQNLEDLFLKVDRINSDIDLFEQHVSQLHKELTEISSQPYIAGHNLVDAPLWSRLKGIGHLNRSISAAIQSFALASHSNPTLHQQILSLQSRFSDVCVGYNNVEHWMRNNSKDVGRDSAPTSSSEPVVMSRWERGMKTEYPSLVTAHVVRPPSMPEVGDLT
jgi:hypothetical protein